MSRTILYFAPSTCARVPLMTLEELGIAYEMSVIAFMAGEHKAPAFLAVNPKGKVPALHIDGRSLTENVAILTYLDRRFPDAGLLPPRTSDLDMADQLADLAFCSSTLHPIVTRLRLSPNFAGPGNAGAVWERASIAMDDCFTLIERRLQTQPWWYGDRWSVMDTYLYWVFFRVEGAGYDVGRFPAFVAHAARMVERPAVRRALEKERAVEDDLRARDLFFTPPLPPAPRLAIPRDRHDRSARPPQPTVIR